MQPLVQTIQRDSAITFPMLGNLTINPPSYFTVFGMDIYFYGVIIGLGFILGIVCCTRICARFGIKEDDMYDAILVIIPTAIIGARLYYVLFRLDYYVQHPNEIFAIHTGAYANHRGVVALEHSNVVEGVRTAYDKLSLGLNHYGGVVVDDIMAFVHGIESLDDL